MKPHKLSDKTTIEVRVERTWIGTRLIEVPSRDRPACVLFWMDSGMYLVHDTKRTDMTRVSHPDYARADTEADAIELALKFFVTAAEAMIETAKEEGIEVEECYRK